MEEEDLSLNWTVFRHFPRVWSGRDDEEKASKSHQESFCSLGTNIKQTLNEVKHWPKRVWECIPPCALCPSLAWTAKLFLTASKHVLTSCSHDTLGLFAFSVNSWLTLCQLEIMLPRKLSMTQKQNSLSPFPSLVSAQPVLWRPTGAQGLYSSSAIEACWVFLRSLSGSVLFPISLWPHPGSAYGSF